MKVRMKQAVRLGGHVYCLGEHDVPEAHCGDWFFKAMVSDGNIELLEAPAPIEIDEPEPEEEQPLISKESAKKKHRR